MLYPPVQRNSGESSWLKFMEIYGSFPGFNCLLLSGQSGEARRELWPAWGLWRGGGLLQVGLTKIPSAETHCRQIMSGNAPQADDRHRTREKQRWGVWLLPRVGTFTWLSQRREELGALWLSRGPSIVGKHGNEAVRERNVWSRSIHFNNDKSKARNIILVFSFFFFFFLFSTGLVLRRHKPFAGFRLLKGIFSEMQPLSVLT